MVEQRVLAEQSGQWVKCGKNYRNRTHEITEMPSGKFLLTRFTRQGGVNMGLRDSLEEAMNEMI